MTEAQRDAEFTAELIVAGIDFSQLCGDNPAGRGRLLVMRAYLVEKLSRQIELFGSVSQNVIATLIDAARMRAILGEIDDQT